MPSRDTERRYTKGSVELRGRRDNVDGQSVHVRVFHGYALKFGKLSQDLGGFVEGVAGRSTIAKTLADGGDVVARMHHKDEYLLGRVSSGTLRLAPDDVGLSYDVDSPGTSYARDLEALAQRGDIRHSSFAFRTIHDDWGLTDSGFPLRTLTEIQLVDVAPVVNPAYLDTSSSVRSLASRLDASPDEVAELLRAGRLAEVLRTPATVLDLAARKFDPRQPRGGDGKWSDGPGGGLPDLTGGDDAPGEPFRALETVRAGSGQKVGVAPNATGGVDLQLRTDEEIGAPVVTLSADDRRNLGAYVESTDEALTARQKLANDYDDASAANPEHQAMRQAAEAKYRESTKLPMGDPRRTELQREALAMPTPPPNPYDAGDPVGETARKIGGLHAVGVLTDSGKEIHLAAEPVTGDMIGNGATVVMSVRQARKLASAVGGQDNRSIESPARDEPDALHSSTAVRARRLELLARRFSL